MLQLIFFSQVIFVCLFFGGGMVMPTNEVETKENENYLR